MKKIGVLIFWSLISTVGFAQIRTITSVGAWNNTGIWSAGNIADVVTEDVTFNNNLGLVTFPSPLNLTVGNVSMNNGNTLTIANGATLNVGDAGNAGTISTGNTAIINVHGSLTIWGDLNVGNSLVLNVTGTLIIKGNVNLGNGASLTIDGDVDIDGNFNAGTGTILDVDGDVDIGGNFTVGNGSTVSGNGTVRHGGTCADGNSSVCGVGPLPIKLLYFNVLGENQKVTLRWATISELNFQKFIIQRSENGIDFSEIGEVAGKGRDIFNIKTDYTFDDNVPLNGINYYRLKALDLDATYEYFKIVAIRVAAPKILTVFPNPSQGNTINFRTNFTTDDDSDRIIVTDARGMQLINAPANSFHNSIDLETPLQPGVYILKYTAKDFESISRIFVQNK
jgi:hypothetical protein